MSVVVVGLIEGVGLLMELALLNSIPFLSYSLIKLTTILVLQWAKDSYIQRLQNACRVRGEADRVNIPFKTKIPGYMGHMPMKDKDSGLAISTAIISKARRLFWQ